MKRNLVCMLLVTIMVVAPTAVFASENNYVMVSENMNNVIEYSEKDIVNSSRWYVQNVSVYKDKPFTEYDKPNDPKNSTKMVSGTESKTAVYHVYRDGSGRKNHQYDIYTIKWTGYQKTRTGNWVAVPGYIDREERVIDRGPLQSFFLDLFFLIKQ